jgi:hypothetical protein
MAVSKNPPSAFRTSCTALSDSSHQRDQSLSMMPKLTRLIGGLTKETTIPAEPRAIRRGRSSNIFTGREEILKRLDNHFGPRKPGDTSRREFHIRGMGGVGKTQIALKFTERNEDR